MKMLVGRSFVEASDGGTIDIINPATGKVIDTVPAATKDDVSRAVETAIAGQKEWARRTVRERCTLLNNLANVVTERRLELGKILSAETGKPYLAEAVWEFDSVAYVIEGACEV